MRRACHARELGARRPPTPARFPQATRRAPLTVRPLARTVGAQVTDLAAAHAAPRREPERTGRPRRPTPERVHLVFCTQAVTGGAWIRLRELLEQLCERGFGCHLLTWTAPEVEAVRGLPGLVVADFAVPEGERNLLRLARESLAALRRAELPRDRAVWAGSFAGASGLGAAWHRAFDRADLRLFAYLRGVEHERAGIGAGRGWPRRLRLAAHRVAMTAMLEATDLLLTQTPEAMGKLAGRYGTTLPERRGILPNNVNASWIRRRLAAAERGEDDGPRLAGDAFRVGFVGRIAIEVKGLDVLCDAAARLEEGRIEFHVVGGGGELPRLRRMVEERGVARRVRLHGALENPLGVVRQCDLLVAPSRSDGMPNAVLEALAAGVPAIGSRVDGIELILRHPELLFDAGDAVELAARVRRAADDGEYRERLRALAAERARAFEFDWAGRFLDLLGGVPEPVGEAALAPPAG